MADEHSDVDLGIAVRDAQLDSLLPLLPTVIADAVEIVLLKHVGRLINVVTEDWTRADIFIRTASEITNGLPGPVQVLHDPGGLVQSHEPTTTPPPPPSRVREVVEEFLRFLGLLPVAVAREEWVGAFIATGTMMGFVVELMQFQNRTHRVGGALRLSERLTDAQKQALGGVPPLRLERSSVIEVQASLAAIFLPLAREVAGAAGVSYPDAGERAVLEHLRGHNIELPTSL